MRKAGGERESVGQEEREQIGSGTLIRGARAGARPGIGKMPLWGGQCLRLPGGEAAAAEVSGRDEVPQGEEN